VTSELFWKPALELAQALRGGDLSAVDVAQAFIERTDEVDGRLHGYLLRAGEDALRAAHATDDRRDRGAPLSDLDGIPVAYKDIFVTRGTTTTCGSRILKDWVPPYDATVVGRCSRAGLPLLGKTNMDEFAMGSSTENSAFGPSRNPWDLGRVPGGSSGGSAALVAAGGVPWAWGTETGGSVRQPASLCGVVGVKPTYGLVSRYGMVAFASSLDQAAPLARTVKDAAALLELASGADPMDSTCMPSPAPALLEGIDGGIEGLRIGVLESFGDARIDAGVQAKVDDAYARLDKMGARLEPIALPSFQYGISAYYLIAPAECSSNLARYDGVRYGYRAEGADDIVKMTSRTRADGFGAEVKRRIMLGTYALSAGYYDAYYGKAQRVRTLIMQELERAYASVDLIVCPTSPTTAFRLGERTQDPLSMYLSDVLTVPVNLAGNAAITVPCGLSDTDGLPVGLQIIAKALDEKTMFRAAYAFEQDLGWINSAEGRPPL
jgi:aspartyl-tRNA(Asn)/glutamyl-tRNA(Gln) amidotransferase subunit A